MRFGFCAFAGLLALTVGVSGAASEEKKFKPAIIGLEALMRMECGNYIVCGHLYGTPGAKPEGTKSDLNKKRREARKQLIKELNFFGFGAGLPDGVIGREARAVISAFQTALGMPATGHFRPHERGFLKFSYERALKDGDAPTVETLTRYYQQSSYAFPLKAVKQQDKNAKCTASSFVDLYSGMMGIIASVSIRATLETDPKFSTRLIEQCDLARDMIRAGHEIEIQHGLAKSSTPDGPYRARLEFCQPLRSGMAQLVGRLDEASPDVVRVEAKDLAQRFGVEDAENGRRIGTMCMGLGYRDRDGRMTLAGALIMLGTGGGVPAAEVIAAHLLYGFHGQKNKALAMDWYELAVTALEGEVAAEHPVPRADRRVAMMRELLDAHQANAAGFPPPDATPAKPVAVTTDTDTD
ncbi:peptidoglycan-binding domain-containing protein [Pseudooceanicola sp. C21-150M6]